MGTAARGTVQESCVQQSTLLLDLGTRSVQSCVKRLSDNEMFLL